MNEFDGSGYYILALDLVRRAKNSPNEDALLRTAISRAYYAAFWKARNYLRARENDTNIPTDADAHSYIRDKFRFSSDQNRRNIGEGLRDLRRERNIADYDKFSYNLSINAPLLVAQAGAIIAAIDAL